MSSFLLTPEVARRAVEIVGAAFADAAGKGVVKSRNLHVVVLDPTVHPWNAAGFADAVLYEHSFARDEWDHTYDELARGKAQATWTAGGKSTDYLQRLAPHLYTDGDVKWSGSVVLDGLIVAASGVQPWFDQAFAGCVASLCIGLCVGNMTTVVLPAAGDRVERSATV